MKKAMFILLILITTLLIFGCTQAPVEDGKLNVQASQNIAGSVNTSEWSEKVAALGVPNYDEVVIQEGYKILPFPGLTYNGLRDGWQAFYATNSDYTFAIYASPTVITGIGTYEEVKAKVMNDFYYYSDTLQCSDISTNDWLTNTQAFVCTYNYLDTISYKIVTIYKNNSYIQTNLSVWGTSLSTYEYIYDEFNQKAVSWK